MYSFCCKSLEKIQINFSSIKLLENKNCCDANGVWYCLLQNGTLKIIDRKKHIFKLSQGEYIVPEKIENIYLRSQYVHQVFLHGESLKSCVVGIVIPDVDVVKCWAVENGIPGTLSVLCANPQVKQLIDHGWYACVGKGSWSEILWTGKWNYTSGVYSFNELSIGLFS